MKLYGVTTAHNVEALIPYVMPYVCRLGYDKFVVYNDRSTDRTVELLSQYEFVEIREFPNNKKPENVSQRNFFLETRSELFTSFYKSLTSEVCKSNELIFMTVTDFDEVIYFANHTNNFKKQIEWLYYSDGYNCYAGRIVNLLPPEPITELFPQKLVHTLPGMRGKLWQNEGMKPVFFCVNDIKYYSLAQGNHYATFTTIDNKKLKNLDEIGCIYTFHLKYIDRQKFLEQQNDYASENVMMGYVGDLGQDIYDNSMLGCSFPLEMYFCLKQFNSARGSIEGMFNHETGERV